MDSTDKGFFIGLTSLTTVLVCLIGYVLWYSFAIERPAKEQCLLRGYPEYRIDRNNKVYCTNDKFAEPLGKVYGQ